MANTLDQNQTSVTDGYEFVFGTTTRILMGQFFQAGASGPISRASISLARSASPTDNLKLKIYNATRSGDIVTIGSTTPIITSTTSIAGSSLPSYPSPFSLANAPFVDFDFDGSVSFVSGNYYLLSAERDGAANDTNKYVWGGVNSNVYTTGAQKAGDSDTTWPVGANGNVT